MQLHTARVFVRDLAAAQAFYEPALGLLQAGLAEGGFFVSGDGS